MLKTSNNCANWNKTSHIFLTALKQFCVGMDMSGSSFIIFA